MSKHTPGPWDIINQYIMAADESVICQWESYTDEVNAHLIAAAPDLLAALKAAYEELRTHIGGDVTVQASEAIAKAEGGTS